MPEGPELHIAARFINSTAKNYRFGGEIVKSEVSTKNPAVDWLAEEYNIYAKTRGKELKVFLSSIKKPSKKTHLLFRFGMSGCFKFAQVTDLPKHAHLRFFTVGVKPAMALCFVDYRRFGRWEIEGDWGKDRGPDPIFEYKEFRSNVLDNLDSAAFNRPICEAMLNQKYFNGIGNYLRAEILYRCGIRPFDEAREVLKSVQEDNVKSEEGDLLELCNIVPKEVLELDSGKSYDPDDSQKSQESFSDWLQCYYVEGMNNLEDGNGRTMWFAGSPGKMAPKVKKVKGRKGKKGTQIPQSGTDIKEEILDDKETDLSNGDSKDNKKVKRNIKVKESGGTRVKKEPKDEKPVRSGKVQRKPKAESAVTRTKVKKEPKIENSTKMAKVKKEPEDEPINAETVAQKRKQPALSSEEVKPSRQSKSRRASSDLDFKKFF